MKHFNFSGPILALLAAFLFGVSPVLIKSIAGEIPPVLMAGLLYLGSGIGLLTLRLIRKESILVNINSLSNREKFELFGAILTGGVLAPICLTYGIFYSTVFQVSALLNLEAVATTLIAYFIFREHVSWEVWFGKILVLAGAILVSMTYPANLHFSLPSLFIVAACVFWGMDNNLTRNLENMPASLLAGIKGLSAGLFNIFLAIMLNQGISNASGVGYTLMIGALSYGLSLVFFVYALRKIGASRTSTYFAVGPFIGMVAAVMFLGERPPLFHWAAGILMLSGVYILFKECHEHIHTHEPQAHSHSHVRDEHHQHEHDGTEGPEPHEHFHKHQAITHSHPHLPDIHHRHAH